MQPIHRLKRWYSFNYGRARAMVEAGATPMRCPHCDEETPLYASEYGGSGDPLTFTVCLWCEGFVEFDEEARTTHEPYAGGGDTPVSHADRTE